jgi:hypothetical protein
MDAMDILGGLLRQKSGSSGLGGAILKSIVTGGRSSETTPQESRPIPQMPAGRPRIVDAPAESEQSPLDGLEDMLRQAHSRPSGQRPATQSSPTQRPQTQFPAHHEKAPTPGSLFPESQHAPNHECSMGQKSELIVQAMINAAKADGQIDQAEQDMIVKQLGQLTQDDVEYLRREFAKPLNLRDFVWSVPLGAEQEIYAISMMTLNLDSRSEVNYLKDLAHGLRLPPQLCAQIHQRFGVPVLH